MTIRFSGNTKKTIQKESEYFCEECNKSLGKTFENFSINVPILLEGTYYEYGDSFGLDYHFCSTKCFREYCRNNINSLRINPDNSATITVKLTIKEFKEKFLYNE